MKKILVIEDEIDIQKILTEILTANGYDIICAGDADLGLQLARKETPDLIILDLILPVGDGLSVLKKIRLTSHTRFTPVLVLTGMDDPKYKEELYKEGIQGYLTKPYNIDSLLYEIHRVFIDETDEG